MSKSLIKEKLRLLPNNPGCYLMKSIDGEIIYVGKAKNLKNRVTSYFVGAHNAKTTLLVSEIADFEYILTKSELESLVLEINLIKNHLPKYNIKLVDDASYPYILLTNETNPRLIVVREELKKKRGQYFGPYPNASSARSICLLLNKIYPYRKCLHIPSKECLYYHINQCLAPCINKKVIDYSEYNNRISRFLHGDTKEILKELEEKMQKASMKLEFEKAKEYRDLINDVKRVTEKQGIVSNNLEAMDFIGAYYSEDEISIEILIVRNGAIVQNYRTIIPYTLDKEEGFEAFIIEHYKNEIIRPKEIYIDKLNNIPALESILGLKIIVPQKGHKKELLDMAYKNAENNYRNAKLLYQNKVIKNENNVYRLGQLLGIKAPLIIEAFDNSNLFGEYPVSAMVVYKNGQKAKNDFRKYHVKTVKGANDYLTMKEVVYRRYYRLLMENKQMPDLIIMDGGVIQVNACKDVIESLGLTIPILGLKKDDTHSTNVLVFEGQEIKLAKNDDLYLFLANIQQCVHDYAISFFRSTKAKGLFSSRLDGIKGLGPKKKGALLKEYLTIEKIKMLSDEEFLKAGINKDLAAKIRIKLSEEQK